MNRLVVADSSPLIGLAVAGAFQLLRGLFGSVTVTRAVLEEVRAGGSLPGTSELESALREGWLRVAPTPAATWNYPELGAGEASTIALALQPRPPGGDAPAVLMDDVLGRTQAAALGLEVLDLPALLLAAKRAGLVDRVQPLFERLARRGFTVPPGAASAALAEAEEAELDT